MSKAKIRGSPTLKVAAHITSRRQRIVSLPVRRKLPWIKPRVGHWTRTVIFIQASIYNVCLQPQNSRGRRNYFDQPDVSVGRNNVQSQPSALFFENILDACWDSHEQVAGLCFGCVSRLHHTASTRRINESFWNHIARPADSRCGYVCCCFGCIFSGSICGPLRRSSPRFLIGGLTQTFFSDRSMNKTCSII